MHNQKHRPESIELMRQKAKGRKKSQDEIEKIRQGSINTWKIKEIREKRTSGVLKAYASDPTYLERVRAAASKPKSEIDKEHMSSAAILRMKRVDYTSKGKFFSQKNKMILYYRSSYELLAFQKLEADKTVRSYQYEPFYIVYLNERGYQRHLLPDLLVETTENRKILIEVKPRWRLVRDSLKLSAMKKYDEENGYDFQVWSEEELGVTKK